MAIPWLAVLKSVPWSTVVSNAPVVADGAKKLWNAVAGKPAAAASPPQPVEAHGGDAAAITALRTRVATLEADAQDTHAQLLASSELIKSLAEQNTQLIARLDLHRRVMRWFAVALVVAIALFALLVSHSAAAAQGGMKGRMGGGPPPLAEERQAAADGPDPEVMGAFFPQRANRDAMEKRGLLATGLVAVYPAGFDCPEVKSPLGAPTRSDGSRRSPRFFQGLHGGMDIPQPDGTPLLALADGEIIVKHEGEQGGIGGLGLWVRHAPADTGLGKYVFIEYKHINKLPDLAVGERVKMGQVIAATGNTGTADGHYGSDGFYHLHMTAYWSDGPDFTFKRALIPQGGQWLDPLALMRGGPLDSHALRELSAEQKKVALPFKTTDGRIFPAATKVVWPYACKPK